MLLSDRDLMKLVEEHELVSPFIAEHCEGATINLTLAPDVKKYSTNQSITLFQEINDSAYKTIDIEHEAFYLQPHESVLGYTYEKVSIPETHAAVIFERYSIKALGIMVSPAGYMNPGYRGSVGVLIVNHAPVPVRLVPGAKICQLGIVALSSPALTPYSKQDAKYMDSEGATISKLHLESEVRSFLEKEGVDKVSDRTVRSLGKHLVSEVRKSAKELADVLRKEKASPDHE